MLWSRACELKASAIELVFFYSILVAAGASSLTHTPRLSKRIIDSLYSIKAAKRFVGEALTLLSLFPIEGVNVQEREYDWCDVSKCPPLLLHCRVHSILCCFLHQARMLEMSLTHGNHAIRYARGYGLFEEIQRSDRSSSASLHIYALRRIQFDLTVYPRLSMSPDAKEECILQAEEACKDVSRLGKNPSTKYILDPLALDFQCLKLVLSEVRAMTCEQVKRERAIMRLQEAQSQDSDSKRTKSSRVSVNEGEEREDSDDDGIIDDNHSIDSNLLAMDPATRILANDDATLAVMTKFPNWTRVVAQSDWFSKTSPNILDGTSAINILWVRFSCNRMRAENLMQPCNVLNLSSQLQARVMEAAQDTLFLLGKT
jgi:hypothetical protein